MDFNTDRVDSFLKHVKVPEERIVAERESYLLKYFKPQSLLKRREQREAEAVVEEGEEEEEPVKENLVPILTLFLQQFLGVFIKMETYNEFQMDRLPNNNGKRQTRILDLYSVVTPDPGYELQQKLLQAVMERLHFDLDVRDFPKYDHLVASLLADRHPVAEVGDFGNLKRFLQREGSFWLQKHKNGYAIDLRRYNRYEVRKHYERYGSRMELDADLNIVNIDGIPEDQKEAFARRLAVFQSTLILDIVLYRHATFCHLLVSQKLYMLASTTCFDLINRDPVLSEFYYLITYRTNDINSKIPVLAGKKGSLLQMGFGFKADSFLQMMTDIYNDPSTQTQAGIRRFLLDDHIDQWKEIAQPVYACVQRFVDRLVGDKVPADFLEQTKLAVFVSTFFHELIGDYQVKTIYNCDLNARTYVDDPYQRRTREFAYIISAVTMGVSVRILKIHELVERDYLHGEHLDAWKAFYEDLTKALGDYPWIDVKNLEFSVGY